MKSIFKKIAFVLALAMVVTAFPAQTTAAASASGPQLKAHRVLYLGGDATETYSAKAYATVWNFKEDGYTVKFESANPEIATVGAKKGMVTAVSVGTTTVTATFSKKGARDVVKTCKVEVKKNAAAVVLDAASEKALSELSVGDTVTLKATATDADGGNNATDFIKFKSSDAEIVSVDKKTGELKAVAPGTAKVTVYTHQYEYDFTAKKYASVNTAEKVYDIAIVSGFGVKATGVRELTVTGYFTKESVFSVKKGTSTINVSAVKIAEDGKSAVLSLGSKLTKGTYTAICGNDSAEVTVEDEKVVDIIIKDNGKYVGTFLNQNNTPQNSQDDYTQIYVHYDVLNQYGESVRKSYSIQWNATSATSIQDNKEEGSLTISANSVLNYGSMVVVTGVHTAAGNAKSQQATVYVGLERRVDKVELVGITKEYSGTILETLPASFTSKDYMLVFKMYDQDGYELAYDNEDTYAKDLSFTSLSPLVLATISSDDLVPGGVVINGEVYGAVRLTPGIQVVQGGLAQIMVTSKKTGSVTSLTLEIVSEQILDRFTLIAPDVIIAEGDGTVNIPFEAYDAAGNAITSFRVLHGAVSLSDSKLKIKENDDKTARIEFAVPANAHAEENVDVPMMFISTVIKTGNVSTMQLNIKDLAVPTSVRGWAGAPENLLEGDSFVLRSAETWGARLQYFDQYGREMSDDVAKARFTGRVAGVKLNSSALNIISNIQVSDGVNVENVKTSAGYVVFDDLTIRAEADVTSAQLSQTFEFVIAKVNGTQTDVDKKYEVQSGSSRKISLNVVDISQCRSFEAGISDYSKLYLNDGTGDVATYEASFWLNGKLANGSSVSIPVTNNTIVPGGTPDASNVYWAVIPVGTAAKNGSASNPAQVVLTGSAITSLVPQFSDVQADGKFMAADFLNEAVKDEYGNATNRFNSFTYKIEVYSLASKKDPETGNHLYFTPVLKDTLRNTIEVNTQAPKYTSFTTGWAVNNGNVTIGARNGKITYNDVIVGPHHNWGGIIDKAVDQYGKKTDKWAVLGQIKVTISKIEESDGGLYFGSTVNGDDHKPLSVVANGITGGNDELMLENVEIGDKFSVTYELGDAVLTLNFTIGADDSAEFTNANDEVIWK